MTDSKFEEVAREYDGIARNYQESTKLSKRVYVDHHTVFQLASPLDGKKVLDLACGEGHRVGQLSIIAVGHLACGAEPRQATLVGEGKYGDKG